MPGDPTAPTWPLFGITISVGEVSLRPVREADLETLVSLLPDDVEHDPSSTMLEGLDLGENRRRLLMQSYWRSWGTWSVDDWYLQFAVAHLGRLVGVQTLEAVHFPALRVVDSSSWLEPGSRGHGIGRAMRTGVLALAFDHLGATAAVSSAREENAPSLGVSHALGYEDNGVERSLSPSGPCTLRRMLLNRETWRSSGLGAAATVTGLDACAPWFGVEPERWPAAQYGAAGDRDE